MSRSVTEIGPGDYIKVGVDWMQVVSNTAFMADPLPREWKVTTIDGAEFTGMDINAYAKNGDRRDMPSEIFVCPRCGARSTHPDDISNGYCGRCHEFTGDDRDVIIAFNENDSLVVELTAASKALDMSFRDTFSFLMGMGLQTAIEQGLIGDRATTPMDTAELFRRLAEGILRGP